MEGKKGRMSEISPEIRKDVAGDEAGARSMVGGSIPCLDWADRAWI
jgi:hypothetical protein